MRKGPVFVALAAMAWPGFAMQNPSPHGHSVTTRIAVRGAWLGVGFGELTPERASALKLKEAKGIEITHVEDNSHAAKAGLRESDVVLEINGQKVSDRDEFVRTIAESTPGSKVNLVIWRNSARQNVSATLSARPAPTLFTDSDGPAPPAVPMPPNPFPPEVLDGSVFQGMMVQSPRIGIEGETLAGQLADFFGVKEGVLVRSVLANSAASKAGLKAGDVIVKVNAIPVANTREISGVIRAAHKNATFTVVRNHREITLNVEIAQARSVMVPRREVL
jgi:serine protease Do